MSAPIITDINVPTAEVMWPETVEITLTFDQPLWDVATAVVFEANTNPLTIEGVPTAPQTPVGLGQTPCRGVQTELNKVVFRFQVSPFANGPLQLSDKYWIRNSLNARNAAGQRADWGPFLQTGRFNSVKMKPYYSWVTISSPGVLYDQQPYPNYPKINKAGVCLGPTGTYTKDVNPKMGLKMGPTVNAPAASIVPWSQGKFYAWWNMGALECEREKPIFDFYNSAFQSKRKYSFADFGYEMRSTWTGNLPDSPYPDGVNSWNYNSAGDEGYVYATCPWIRPSPMPTGGVDWIGRLEWFIMSTEKLEMVQGLGQYASPPDGWWGNSPSGVNSTNLAPWNLAPPRDGFYPDNSDFAQALVQVYIAQGWSYLTYQPPTV
jgi:hypothetical protein